MISFFRALFCSVALLASAFALADGVGGADGSENAGASAFAAARGAQAGSLIAVSTRPAYFSVQCVEFAVAAVPGESPRATWEKAIRALKIASLPPGAGQRDAGLWVGTVERASNAEFLNRLSSVGPSRVAFSQSLAQRPRTLMRFSGGELAPGESVSVGGYLRGARDLSLAWHFAPGRANSRIFATRGFATLTAQRSFVIAYARDGALRVMALSSTPSASLSPLAVW